MKRLLYSEADKISEEINVFGIVTLTLVDQNEWYLVKSTIGSLLGLLAEIKCRSTIGNAVQKTKNICFILVWN